LGSRFKADKGGKKFQVQAGERRPKKLPGTPGSKLVTPKEISPTFMN